jgi:hypothetical protein
MTLRLAPAEGHRLYTSAQSVLVNDGGYQLPLHDRVHVSALAGLFFLHITRDYTTTGATPLAQIPAPIVTRSVRPHTLIDHVPAATVGAEIAFALRCHLAVVPDVHVSALTLSNGGPSGFAIRPGIGARWTF